MAELAMPTPTQPEQRMISKQNVAAVQQLLNTLEPSYRTPVVLRYWYDMSYKEIAETMGVTESTIKTRLHRARAKLACAASAQRAQTDRDVEASSPANAQRRAGGTQHNKGPIHEPATM
jgi:DNA-directed RNA polymerase specialized sigma24 family protein